LVLRAFRKWRSIASWSVGLEPWTRDLSKTTSAALKPFT
jgi:hypothetical protein